MKTWILILMLLNSCLAYAAPPQFPPFFTASYKLYARGLAVGEGTRRFAALENGQFVFESHSNTTGMLALFRDDRIVERSVFTLENGQALPIEYIYQHQGSKKQKQTHIAFDWQNKMAKSLIASDAWEVALTQGILDKSLYQLVVMQELMQGKRELNYSVVDRGKIIVYTPTFLGTEQIKTGVGTLETLKYERIASNQKRRTTLWCAPALHFLPVRVDHQEKEDGEVITMVLQSVKGLEK